MIDLNNPLLSQAIGTFFGIAQAGILAVLAAGIKTYFDVKTLRRDVNEAFAKIRQLEKGRHTCQPPRQIESAPLSQNEPAPMD